MMNRDVFVRARRFYENKEKEQNTKDVPTLRADDLSLSQMILPEAAGLQRFNLFEEILENGFGKEWKRTDAQRGYQDLCTRASAPLIIGNDWEIVGPELCKTRGWEYIAQLVICKMARQHGKSVATAQVIVALALCFAEYPPKAEFKIATFSTGNFFFRRKKNILERKRF